MSFLKLLLIGLAAAYLGVLALMYVFQRKLMYFPEVTRTPPAAAGLAQAEEVTLTTADGERLIAWHVPAKDERPVFLYFHGNGGSLRLRADRFRRLTADGSGVLAVSYRGYAGSSGSPSEAGLLADADAAYAFVRERYAPERIVVFGESLGTAVALAVAVKHPARKLILDAPYTAAADVAASVYPFVPIRFLMKDQFRAGEWARQVKIPTLILHGEMDRIIPIGFAEALHELIVAPKSFVRFPRGGHVDLDSHGAVDAVRQFLAAPG
ncbi:MAG: uncharacterized protein QOD74_1015 [Variibacter sp.]|jgi:fermentation-respiration switch protein FrsA (DUF1100 family)|nr:uncharacterized protein [Variibacter sp.]